MKGHEILVKKELIPKINLGEKSLVSISSMEIIIAKVAKSITILSMVFLIISPKLYYF